MRHETKFRALTLIFGSLALIAGSSASRAQEDLLDDELGQTVAEPAPAETLSPAETTQNAGADPDELNLVEEEPAASAPKSAEKKPAPSEPAPVAEKAPAPQLAPAPPPEPAPAPMPVASGGSDEPNLELEKRLFRIFSGTRPVAPEKWAEMIGSRKEDVYAVQAGDTLWDISKTLFGDGFFWSKLWAENGALENPHVISKGKGIRFVAGNEDAAPAVDVVSEKAVEMIRINALRETRGTAPTYREQALKELTPEELMNQNAVEVEELIPQPEIPPIAKPNRAVLPNLPSSFVSKIVVEDHRYDITGLDAGRDRTRSSVATMIPESYILDKPQPSIGRVDEIETGEKVASVGQNVFVRLTRPAQVGQKLSVVFAKGKVQDAKRGPVGPVMEVGGTVQILSAIDERKNVYRANVTHSVNPIRRGSLVIDEPLPKMNFARKGTRLNVEVRVIGGELDEKRRLIGEGSVVYLDGGARAGLSKGDILSVLARRGSRREGTRFPDWRRPIGLLKIVRAEPTVATAVVLDAQDEIVPGDRTGAGIPEPARTVMDHDADVESAN